ncbi:TPA: FliA/WhiG family RNA polymerase sigma factor [Candidatus Poribacteria bacterium]|jgi:RNA polymerase sigma factor for flagellar operon FliA|nr:FliA/WhiG family RNA polymerase sigma factor [Candidatus Poribacteria bacterium]HIA70326.1 FliA/WhiG family RNA polymerase sigma factor [Candidatus Poribacteria bacterium]HIB89022.1 FliA/WhiG family RNA polymerase sigma factor [Candidatus Poribacteria bacterium]HIC03387.1 FliA/WhiG family RNA polymerase sigma factor [Candidatus Poribacteria bacterium]HIM09177.1 FliA/WhiG family RNA polymerase sigma factor [Candidatus Poribacteria bacterium]
MKTTEELWRAYKFDDDSEAKEQLIDQCLPLIKSIAYRASVYASPSYDLDDLVSIGIMGMLDAIDRFDPTKGATFKTFASHRIRGAVLDEIRALDWVPRSVRRQATQLESAYRRLEQQTGRAPDEFEVAQEMGMTIDEVHQALAETSCTAIITLNDLTTDVDEQDAIQEFIADPSHVDAADQLIYEETKNLLAEAIDTLPERDKLVLSLYYNEELTMKEIGLVLDVKESRVSQLHSSAILRLRAGFQQDHDVV